MRVEVDKRYKVTSAGAQACAAAQSWTQICHRSLLMQTPSVLDHPGPGVGFSSSVERSLVSK